MAESLDNYSILIDTYDVHAAIDMSVEVANEARQRWGHELSAVRLDSGDLLADSQHVRGVLDRAGLTSTKVLVSGDLDEFRIADLLHGGAPIDGFGVGGNLDVGLGSVASGAVGGTLGAVYKLTWYAGDGDPAKIKLAGEKSTWPGRKAVSRIGNFERDVIHLDDEPAPAGSQPLLQPVVSQGQIVADLPELSDIRAIAAHNLAALPAPYRALRPEHPYPVEMSEGILALRERASQAHRR